MMGNGTEVRRHSLLPQNPKLSEVFTPRSSRALKPREKDKAYRWHPVAQDIAGRPLFPPRFPANHQKLWPNRVSVGAEELVKHMSNVPSYLQRIVKGDNLQEKALNFGVLDWRRLERWTDNHRRATVSENAADSPASSDASSSFLTYGSSGQSFGSSHSSYLTQRKQSLSLNRHQDSSSLKDHTQISEAASIISKDRGYHRPQIASRKCAARHNVSGLTERCQRMDNLVAKCESTERCQHMDNLATKYGECKRRVSNSIPGSVGPSAVAVGSTSPSRSKNCGISGSVVVKVKPLVLRSDFKKMSGDVDHVYHNTTCCTAAGCPQDHHCGPFRIGDGMSDHFEESIRGDQRFSVVSTVRCMMPAQSGHTSFVGTSPSEDFLFSRLSPSVPHSCPLPIDVNRSERSDVNESGSDHCEEPLPCDSVKSPKHSNEVATLRSNGSHEKHDECASKLQKGLAFERPENLHREGTKTFTTGGGSLPNDKSNDVLIKSSSLKESSGTKEAKWMSLNSRNGDVEADISKSRRSPLRRLLDPLLKPKAFNRSQAAGLTATSPGPRLASSHGPQGSSHITTNCSGGEAVKGITPPRCMPVEKQDSVYDDKHESFPKQAILQLSWKGGLPVFTFSVNESDILAATWKKGRLSSKEDCECIYTFYYVREIKKKFGGWISQGNKGKRKELTSSVVGQMKVSCLRCPKNHFAMREFILFGPGLKPTPHETLDPVPTSELAAVVLRVPEESTESSFGNLPHGNESRDLLKTNPGTNKHDSSLARNQGHGQILENNVVPKMVAILPSEVHGLSDSGKPATLIERWKSGGLCDCGGWDVGCSLTILTDNVQDSWSGGVQSCCYPIIDATHRVELFAQGGGQERRPVFSLVGFKEGLYTVDFDPSIAVLQAFTVCVAILHGKKQPKSLDEPQDSMQDSRLCPSAKRANSLTSMPCQPPVSPVGRA